MTAIKHEDHQRLVGFLVPLAAVVGFGLAAGGSQGDGKLAPEDVFSTSDNCLACHNNLVSDTGADLSIGRQWQSTVMAHAAKDPYWHASVRREILDHPQADEAIQDKCSTCHMPMARFVAAQAGRSGNIFDQLPMTDAAGDDLATALSRDGVSCSLCHQIAAEGLGEESSFTGGFAVDTTTPLEDRSAYGPFAIARPTTNIMRSATGFVPREASHVQRSTLCASCHTVFTHSLDKDGNEVGVLPEQVPYLEWLHSDYAETQSCQDCHMPEAAGAVQISSVLGKPRENFSRHAFRGGNFFLLRLLGRFGEQLGVLPTAQELGASARDTMDHLAHNGATITIADDATTLEDGRLSAEVVVQNLGGHKLPTAYPSRRVWIHLVVQDSAGGVIFQSGKLADDGTIAHNDNDADGARYEPHYTEITAPEQVQIFEAVLGAPDGRVTTGLLEATQYLKDNRVLPFGFDKQTADADVAVRGVAMEDAGFTGGQTAVRYVVDVNADAGPVKVIAQLWYQPIGFRWADNLADYDAEEPREFVSMYNAMPRRESALMLASNELVVEPPPTAPAPEPVAEPGPATP